MAIALWCLSDPAICSYLQTLKFKRCINRFQKTSKVTQAMCRMFICIILNVWTVIHCCGSNNICAVLWMDIKRMDSLCFCCMHATICPFLSRIYTFLVVYEQDGSLLGMSQRLYVLCFSGPFFPIPHTLQKSQTCLLVLSQTLSLMGNQWCCFTIYCAPVWNN